jgi:hypothetical protein
MLLIMADQPHKMSSHERQAIEKRIQAIEAELQTLAAQCSTHAGLVPQWQRLFSAVADLQEQVRKV